MVRDGSWRRGYPRLWLANTLRTITPCHRGTELTDEGLRRVDH